MRRCAALHRLVRLLPVAACLAALGVLPACRTSGTVATPAPVGPSQPPAAAAEIIGVGGTRVALLLPRSGGGNAPATAAAFRNAAELAVRDFPNSGVQIAVYDTGGNPAGAQAAAASALSEGAEMLLGPVFAGEVAAVAPQARQAGAPVVAFSSDASVAGPGVYLLSFLPSDDAARIVSYAAGEGRRALAGLFPADAYGAVMEAAFRRAAAAAGGRIVAIETYGPGEIAAKAARVAANARGIDALLVPEGGDAPRAAAAALAAAGVTREGVKLLGSGQWDDPRILQDPALVGAWFPAPAKQGFEGFAQRYAASYGAPPPRTATLAYDGAVLAAGLARQFGADRFRPSVLANPNGFVGIDGVFRFAPSGETERRLAVYEVTGSGARVVDPAARSFAGGS